MLSLRSAPRGHGREMLAIYPSARGCGTSIPAAS